MPQKLEALEGEKKRLMETLNSPAFYVNRDTVEINTANDRLEALEEELDEAYGRWEELVNLRVPFRVAAKFSGEPG